MREFGLDECEVLGETEIQVMVAKRLMLIAGNDDATTNDDKGRRQRQRPLDGTGTRISFL